MYPQKLPLPPGVIAGTTTPQTEAFRVVVRYACHLEDVVEANLVRHQLWSTGWAGLCLSNWVRNPAAYGLELVGSSTPKLLEDGSPSDEFAITFVLLARHADPRQSGLASLLKGQILINDVPGGCDAYVHWESLGITIEAI